ncbi:MAG: hypothetical protein F7B19_04045 [Desulfurococcales archaeon]|nr:hypothetical protein [Desulfurococcales archaeon]
MDRIVFNAQIIFKTISRLAGAYMANPPKACSKALDPHSIILMTYEYRSRRGLVEDVLKAISCSLAIVAKEIDASRIGLASLTISGEIGFHELIQTLNSLYKKPSPQALKQAILAIGYQLTKPCARDQRLDNELKVLDKRMKLYGALLGATFPILFVISMYSNLILGIIIVLVATGLWLLIRRDGARYRYLSVEKAWAECKMTRDSLERLLLGKAPVPSLFELFGIPPPRID